MPFLETDRLALEPAEEDDAEVFVAVNHSDGMQTYGGLRKPSSTAAVRDYIAETEDILLTISRDGEVIGYAGLTVEDKIDRRAEVYIYLLDEQQGNGYGPEALYRILQYGFEELNLHKVSGEAFSHNRPSQRMFEKLGFQHEGTFREERFKQGQYRDVERYGLLRADLTAPE
jgi:RimJ/RimL family protein N-acetyltransferase